MSIFGRNPNRGYSAYGDVASSSGAGNHNAGLATGTRVTGVYQTSNGRYGFQDSLGNNWYGNSEDGKFYRNTGHGRDWVTLNLKNNQPKEEEKPSGGGSSGGAPIGGGSSGGGQYTNPYAGNTGNSGLDSTTLALMELIASMTESLAEVKGKTADLDEVSKGSSNGIKDTILGGGYTASIGDGKDKKKKSYLTPISVLGGSSAGSS